MNILATCTPYQVGNIPVRGEHIAWMESSAVIYATSVLGARTNCEGTASAGAASLTGKIPCWGNHRKENRYGTHLIDVRTPVDSAWSVPSRRAPCCESQPHETRPPPSASR